MSVLTVLGAVLCAMLADNLVTYHMLGAGSLAEGVPDLPTALTIGSVTGVCAALSSLILWPVDTWVLTPLRLGFLRILLCLLVCAALARLSRWLINGFLPRAEQWLKGRGPSLEVNSAVLGAALLAPGAVDSFGAAVIWSVAAGLGFLLTITLFAGIRIRLEFSNCPRAFRGFPIAMVSLALLALVFSGFAGLRV